MEFQGSRVGHYQLVTSVSYCKGMFIFIAAEKYFWRLRFPDRQTLPFAHNLEIPHKPYATQSQPLLSGERSRDQASQTKSS
jgi:hypothetical protein